MLLNYLNSSRPIASITRIRSTATGIIRYRYSSNFYRNNFNHIDVSPFSIYKYPIKIINITFILVNIYFILFFRIYSYK